MGSEISDFTESQIRRAILKKAPLERINKGGKHWKGYLYASGKLVGKVKIPNDHRRVMRSSKSSYIAKDLCLDDQQFNQFVQCTLSGPQYTKHLSDSQ